MENDKSEKATSPGLDLDNLKLDNQKKRKLNYIKEDELMDNQPIEADDTVSKTARLAKINLIVSVVGIGILGFLHFSNQGSAEEAIASSKAALKQDVAAQIQEGLAGGQSPQIQALMDKNIELELKVDGYKTQITDIEIKLSQFQAELEKSASLRNKVAELQASMKKAKPATKIKDTSSKSAKGKTKNKTGKKKRK